MAFILDLIYAVRDGAGFYGWAVKSTASTWEWPDGFFVPADERLLRSMVRFGYLDQFK
jgi:hypothetical protein